MQRSFVLLVCLCQIAPMPNRWDRCWLFLFQLVDGFKIAFFRVIVRPIQSFPVEFFGQILRRLLLICLAYTFVLLGRPRAEIVNVSKSRCLLFFQRRLPA